MSFGLILLIFVMMSWRMEYVFLGLFLVIGMDLILGKLEWIFSEGKVCFLIYGV